MEVRSWKRTGHHLTTGESPQVGQRHCVENSVGKKAAKVSGSVNALLGWLGSVGDTGRPFKFHASWGLVMKLVHSEDRRNLSVV